MIRCLAVDDEEYAADIIAGYIQKIPFLSLAGISTSAIDALSRVEAGEIDLVFLDIQMPELTGLQFLKLCGNKCKVIITTAYPQYALDGYEYSVIDYLVKPIEFERFFKAAQKAFQILSLPIGKPKPDPKPVFEPEPPAAAEPTYIFVKGEHKSKFIKVDFDQILYLEGLKNYVSLYTTKQRIVTYQGLGNLETQLPQPPFVRVHKSYIVSMDKIRLVDGNTIHIQDQQIPIGEMYKESFFKMIRSGGNHTEDQH